MEHICSPYWRYVHLFSGMTHSRRSVLITGCSSGIGHALALEFHAKGLQVFATARSAAKIQDLADCGMKVFELDVTDDNAILQVRDQVSEITGGKLDMLVNNAGQLVYSAASDHDMDKIEALYKANLFGAMRMDKAYIPLLMASGDGRIVQIGSMAAITPLPFASAYSGSKAALQAYGDALRVELAPFKIKVINVCSGAVKTNIFPGAKSFPNGSMYKSMEDIFQVHRLIYGEIMAPEKYAKYVVPLTLKKSPPPWIWSGTGVWPFWFIGTFLSRSLFGGIMSRMFGLSELAKRMKFTTA